MWPDLEIIFAALAAFVVAINASAIRSDFILVLLLGFLIKQPKTKKDHFKAKTLEILKPKCIPPLVHCPVVSPINPFSIMAREFVK